ncbi:ribosomal L7Ae/L30e/S12e/Gadd45 family protein [Candidatus Woesearchaeota archaeon]|nr:ribosomal L7Ae/L30e/S12e/Gadd45 family protein [Candidatus Woesearchaeota archaeon]
MSLEELRKALKEGKLIYGTDRTMKLLKSGKLSAIFISSNCPKNLKDEFKKIAKIGDIKVNELKETNEELGTICKKTFSISVVSY